VYEDHETVSNEVFIDLEVLDEHKTTFTPGTRMTYDYDDSLDDEGPVLVDLLGVEWTNMCNPASITLSGINSEFMTISADGLNTITFNPTLLRHLGSYPITIVQTDDSTDGVPDRTQIQDFIMKLEVKTEFELENKTVKGEYLSSPLDFLI
jgi:hypothetical protein